MENIFKKPMFYVVAVLVAVLLGVACYFYVQYNSLKNNPNKILQNEAAQLLVKVKKLMFLPENELPVIATVANPELLKDQPFFTNAKKGDRLLLYPNNRKAVLYDPVANKIVEVAPLNIGAPVAPAK